jgi:hypothetical protein
MFKVKLFYTIFNISPFEVRATEVFNKIPLRTQLKKFLQIIAKLRRGLENKCRLIRSQL